MENEVTVNWPWVWLKIVQAMWWGRAWSYEVKLDINAFTVYGPDHGDEDVA